MCGTAAGGFMCFIVRLIARPFMSLSDTTPALDVAGTSYAADLEDAVNAAVPMARKREL
jgi:hypothetical protein